MVGFLEARSSMLNAIHQIVNRSGFERRANDGLATDSDVQNYNSEFNALQQQLAILREEKFMGHRLFATSPFEPGHPPLFTSLDGNLAPQSNQFQVDTVTVSNLEAGGTYLLSLDGHQLASEIAFNTDAATTASDLVTAVNADATLSSIVTATDNGDGSFSLTSVSPKIVFHTDIFTKDGDVAVGASVSTTRFLRKL